MTWSNYRVGRPACASAQSCPAAVARHAMDGKKLKHTQCLLLFPPFTFTPFWPYPSAHVCVCLCVRVPATHSPLLCLCVSPQEFLSDREHGQARLSTVAASGELLMVVVSKDRVEGIKAKISNAREDWKSLMNNLQTREDALKVWTFQSSFDASLPGSRIAWILSSRSGKCFLFQLALALVIDQHPMTRRVKGRK